MFEQPWFDARSVAGGDRCQHIPSANRDSAESRVPHQERGRMGNNQRHLGRHARADEVHCGLFCFALYLILGI